MGAVCCAPTSAEARFVNRLCVLLVAVGACARPSVTDQLARATWVDLTYPFDSTTIYWPTAKPFRLEMVSAQRTAAGYYYAANNFAAAEHGGTHLDAPVHFAEGGLSTDQIPLARLTGPAVVIDVSGQADADRDFRVAPADLEAWELDHRPIAEGSIVLIRTGWGSRWPDRARYLGTTKTGPAAVAQPHFPGIYPHAARRVGAHKMRAAGIDTPRIDYRQSPTFDTPPTLFPPAIPALENRGHPFAVPPAR